MSSENSSEWGVLRNLIATRLAKAFKTPSFVFTFFGVIVFAGSIGIWFPCIIKLADTPLRPEGFFTYSITIVASVIAEILLKNDDFEGSKGFKMLLFFLIIISIFCLFFDLASNRDVTWVGSIGLIIVLSVWLVANANDEKYDDKQSPNSPIGGDVLGSEGLSGEGL